MTNTPRLASTREALASYLISSHDTALANVVRRGVDRLRGHPGAREAQRARIHLVKAGALVEALGAHAHHRLRGLVAPAAPRARPRHVTRINRIRALRELARRKVGVAARRAAPCLVRCAKPRGGASHVERCRATHEFVRCDCFRRFEADGALLATRHGGGEGAVCGVVRTRPWC